MRKATVTSGGGTGGIPHPSQYEECVIHDLPFTMRAELERIAARRAHGKRPALMQKAGCLRYQLILLSVPA